MFYNRGRYSICGGKTLKFDLPSFSNLLMDDEDRIEEANAVSGNFFTNIRRYSTSEDFRDYGFPGAPIANVSWFSVDPATAPHLVTSAAKNNKLLLHSINGPNGVLCQLKNSKWLTINIDIDPLYRE